MKLLAVEFSSAQRSMAIWDDSDPAINPVLLATALDPRRASSPSPPHTCGGEGRGEEASIKSSKFPIQRTLSLAEEALAKAKCAREEIGILAVGLGPGSYTGIRGAIALAQGWQLGRGVNLLGVSTVECLAAQAVDEGLRGPVYIIIDAQRAEFYLACYQIAGPSFRETESLRLATKPEIDALAAANQTLLGPDIARWFPGARNLYPSAATLGHLACGRRDFVPGETLEPIYLRQTAFKKAPPPRVNP
jgi:tRNA threonylcarbamoyladenosine biosynthesis protein TsaB